MRPSALALAIPLTLAACAPTPSSEAQKAIATVLDDWHDAAAHADEDRYFRHFTDDAVFLGTDATERWTTADFRAYAHPHFAKGKAWSFKSIRRAITLDPSGAIAWFDEDLDTPNLGPCRGSGVLIHRGAHWKIAQYNLALTIPNDRIEPVKRALTTPPPSAP